MAHQGAMFIPPSSCLQRGGCLTNRNFGANFLSLVLRPTNYLSTLHNTCSSLLSKSPPVAQDSVTNHWLGFIGVAISNHRIS